MDFNSQKEIWEWLINGGSVEYDGIDTIGIVRYKFIDDNLIILNKENDSIWPAYINFYNYHNYHKVMQEVKLIEGYLSLIARVEAIDKDAAEYLRTNVFKLRGGAQSNSLDSCFVFAETPQGHRYWKNIADKIDTK